ncbi:hypothetical protein OAT67_00395 [Bacteriovoracaceae bacterium]|nr:hypothetical protein [Bacteriovoracaceae bacterium]
MVSCQNQKPSEIEVTSTAVQFSLERAKACQNTNFTKNILSHLNVTSLFKCAGWDKMFPIMNDSLSNINSSNWNHVFEKFDNEIFNNREKREKIFGIIKDLDSKGGLSHLSNVMNSLSETNFYDSMYMLFYCSKHRDDKRCIEREEYILTHEELVAYFQYFKFPKENFQTLAYITQDFTDSVKNVDTYNKAIQEATKDDKFLKVRRSLINTFVNKIKSGVKKEDLKYFESILTSEVNNAPFLYNWLQSTPSNKLLEILRYPYAGNVEIIPSLISVKKAIESNFVCADQAGLLQISTKDAFEEFMDVLSNGSQKDFFNFLYRNINSIQIAQRFCPVVRNYTTRIRYPHENSPQVFRADFLTLMGYLGDFFLTPQSFEIIKFLQVNSESNDYLLDFFTGDIFFTFVEFSRVIDVVSPTLLPELVDLLKSLDANFYKLTNSLGLELLKKESSIKHRAIWKAWNFFKKEEREFAFRFFDKHFEKDGDFKLLLKFYSKMLFETSIETEVILERLLSDDQIDDTLKAFEDIFKFLSNNGNDEILKEFKVFFSKDHILKVIEVISRGIQIDTLDFGKEYILSNSDILKNLKKPNVLVGNSLPTWDLADYSKKCINYLQSLDFQFLLEQGLGPCERFKDEEILTSYVSSFYKLNKYLTNIVKGKFVGSLGDQHGLFSPRLLSDSITTMKLLEKNGVDIASVMKILKSHFFEKGVVNENFEDLRSVVLFIENYISNTNNVNRNKLYVDVGRYDPLLLKKELTNIKNFFFSYLESNNHFELTKRQDKYSCKNFLNQNIGGNVCPDSEHIERVVDYIFYDLIEDNSEDDELIPIALEQLLKSIKVDAGLMIPYDRKDQKNYSMSAIETLDMMYKTTLKGDKRNQMLMPYLENPEVYKMFYKDRFDPIRRNDSGKEEREEKMTTMERIETLIRDVRFDSGYLGFHYMNAVSKSKDYSNVVNKKRRLLKFCVPLRFCGKHLNRTQKRLAENSVVTFDSLLDVNRYEDWKYGDYMKTLLGAFVSSSGKASQTSSIVRVKLSSKKEIDVPWVGTKKQMKKHNGKILTSVSMVALFSNMGRIIHSYNQEGLEEFLNRKDVRTISENLLRGVPEEALVASLTKTVSILSRKQIDGKNISFYLSEWLKSATPETRQMLFEVVFKMIGISNYIGPADFDKNIDSDLVAHNNNLNILDMLDLANKFIPHWQYLMENFNLDMKLESGVDEIFNLVDFLYKNLYSTDNIKKNEAYSVLNMAVRIISNIHNNSGLVDDMIDWMLIKNNYHSFVRSVVSSNSLIANYFNNKELQAISKKALDVVLDSNYLQFDGVLDYIGLNGIAKVCEVEGDCSINFHNHEIEKILSYLSTDNGYFLEESFKKPLLYDFIKTNDFLSKTLNQIELSLD